MILSLGIQLPLHIEKELYSQFSLEEKVKEQEAALVAEGTFTHEDIRFVKSFTLPAASGALDVSDEVLERLRRVAQIWDVSLKEKAFTSHRKVIGPVIVGIKRLLYPVISFFLADTLRQQRDFNAAVLRCLVELSRKEEDE